MAMRIVLHEITRREESHAFNLTVSIGDGPHKYFIARYDGSRPKIKLFDLDHELFMQLSDLAVRRYGNAAVCQSEIMGIVEAFDGGQPLPLFPIELGTTSLGPLMRPNPLHVIWNKLLVLLHRLNLLSL